MDLYDPYVSRSATASRSVVAKDVNVLQCCWQDFKSSVFSTEMILMARPIFHIFVVWFCCEHACHSDFLAWHQSNKKWSLDISLKQSQAATRPWQLDSKDHPAPRKTSEASRRMRCIHNRWIFFVSKITAKLRFVGWRCVCVCLKFVFWLEDIRQLSDLKFVFSYGEQGFEMCWSSILFLYTFLS